MGIRYSIKRRFRPFVHGPLRTVVNYLRNVEGNAIQHTEVAALVGTQTPTILELGCNDGTDSAKLIETMPGASLYCFEPDQRAIDRFKSNPLLSGVPLYEMAIGSHTGEAAFHPSTSAGGQEFDQSGSIRSPKNTVIDYPWLKFKEPITIRTMTLDDWCRENAISNVDFIWMDVQGAERDVIDGGQNTLPLTRFIYTEYSDNELYEGQIGLKEILARLPTFEVVKRYRGDILLRNKLL